MTFEDITAEQREMARGKSPEEMFELAEKLGRKLTDEEVEQVAGGATLKEGPRCPNCGSVGTVTFVSENPHRSVCGDCGYEWYPNK